MGTFAVVDGNSRVANIIQYDGTAPFSPGPGLFLINASGAPAGLAVGWSAAGGAFTAPDAEPEPPAPVRTRYVPVWQARERLEAAGHWDDLVTWLSADMPRLIKLLTLAEGLDPDDPEVRAVLAGVGANPDEILA